MLALLVLSALLAAPAAAHEPVHGVTVSCPTWGWEWGSDEMVDTLDVLQGLGVEWISIHPYARIDRSGHVGARELDPQRPPAWLTRPIEEAHARGMKVMIKPHLAYWGSGFSWRGDIAFDDPAARDRFFSEYQAWVTGLASVSAAADAFVVGTELDATLAEEERWREVVASVRTVFPGHLTYAANWDRFESVPFWDALDAVGVQAYFPIAPDVRPEALDAATLDRGWEPWLVRLRGIARRTGKPVVFTELGYDRSPHAARVPWEPGAGDPALGARVQELALEAAFRAIEREPDVVGAFLWKWFPGEVEHGDFRMSEVRIRERIQRAWGGAPAVVGSRAGGTE
jgi:hypothetical protein